MSGGEAASDAAGAGGGAAEDSPFECNICLDQAAEPTITQCGHLFCWPCLYRWLETNAGSCPVCKAGVTKENVIPLYGRGKERPRAASEGVAAASGEADEGGAIPRRPAARRPPPPPEGRPRAAPGDAGTGPAVQFTSGLGFFPSLFGLQFQSFNSPFVSAGATPAQRQHAQISRLLIALAVVVILALLFL